MMGRRGRRTKELGGSKIRSEHVDLHESSCVQRAKSHEKFYDLRIKAYYGRCQLGL